MVKLSDPNLPTAILNVVLVSVNSAEKGLS